MPYCEAFFWCTPQVVYFTRFVHWHEKRESGTTSRKWLTGPPSILMLASKASNLSGEFSTLHTILSFFPLLGQNHLLSSASKNISCRQAFSIGSKFLTETEKGEKRSLLFASTYQVRIVPKINFLSISVFL